jgi:hypothetical protein
MVVNWFATGKESEVRWQPSETKTMKIVFFFNARGIVRHAFVPQGQTVNQEF